MAKKIELRKDEREAFRSAVRAAEAGDLILNVSTLTVHEDGCLDEWYVNQPDQGPWIAKLSRQGVERLPWYRSCGTCEPGLNPRERLPDRTGHDPLATMIKATGLDASHIGRRPILDGILHPPIVEIEHHQQINSRTSWSTVTLHCEGNQTVTLNAADLRLELLRRDAEADEWATRRTQRDTPDKVPSGSA